MDESVADGSELHLPVLTDAVARVLATLRDAGHDAAIVGGALRDLLLEGEAIDWDVTTSATPEVVAGLFPGSTWENRFGTVTVRSSPPVQVTTYRTERGYRDRRRPDEVRWGASLEEDLARRDFTINALAWVPLELDRRTGRLVDLHAGLADLRRATLRAVGDPDARLAEDALRVLRGIRFASRFGLRIEPATEAALRRHATTVTGLSGERVRDELLQILAAPRPSGAFALMEHLGVLPEVLPELAALRGIPQNKPRSSDALDHSLHTADTLPASDPLLRLAGLLHDVGKAVTLQNGHFHGHEREGAEMVERIGHRLRLPNQQVARLAHLVAHHMFGYTSDWTDAAVRRFVRRVGTGSLDDLLALRRADNEASGAANGEPVLADLERRIAELGRAPLEARDLAIDGHRLQRELGLQPGPLVGELLAVLLEQVLDEPARNDPDTLLRLAREALEERGAPGHRAPPGPRRDRVRGRSSRA